MVLFLIAISNTFAGELFLSFLPYIIAIYLGFMFILTGVYMLVRVDLKRLNWYWFNWITIFFAFLFIFSFYFDASAFANTGSDDMKIITINLWYKNKNYSQIESFFMDEDADMLLLTEFTDTQHEALADYLDANYPYQSTQLSNISKPYTGKAVFSKYPLTAKKVDSDKFAELFEVVEVNHPAKKFDLTLVHTTAPVNNDYYKARNDQLVFLGQELVPSLSESSLITGDFNTSPWSPKFVKVSRELKREGLQVVDYNTVSFSWSMQPYTVLKSHIDHTFLTQDMSISGYELKDFPGSDHKAQVFEVGL